MFAYRAHLIYYTNFGVLCYCDTLLMQTNILQVQKPQEQRMELQTAYQMVIATLLSQNLTSNLPSSNSSRIFVMAWLVFAFILGTVYRGNLTAALTLPRSPPRAETLEDLVRNFDQ